MRQRRQKRRHEHAGQPTKMTPDVLNKLEDAFMSAYTDEMACRYAGISHQTLYNYCKKNPEYVEHKEALKLTPDLKAQRTLVGDVDNVSGARYWAEHRMGNFMPTSKVILGGTVEVQDVSPGDEAIKAITDKYEKDFEEAVAEQIRKKYADKKK